MNLIDWYIYGSEHRTMIRMYVYRNKIYSPDRMNIYYVDDMVKIHKLATKKYNNELKIF